MLRQKHLCSCNLAVLIVCGLNRGALAWSYQGHILMTRLAALRIINDPSAPQALRSFLRDNMPHTMAECESLAVKESVGAHPEDKSELYDRGLDHWSTMPDQVRFLPEGRQKIEPFGAGEGQMHFLDMEVFGPQFSYKDDLSNKPKISDIPHDLSDPRWKLGGFVPLRVEQEWNELRTRMKDLAVYDRSDDPRLTGYLAHYVEDSTQPHHATVDFKSLTYLCGTLKGLPPVADTPELQHLLRAPEGVDPHGAIEFKLFDNADEPLATYRKEYWKNLIGDIDALSAEAQTTTQPTTQPIAFDPFHHDLEILSDSYDYLPFVGRASRAGYANGTFDAKAFFTYEGEAKGQKMTMVQLIALQNAKAVLEVEKYWRTAWTAAHAPTTPTTQP